MCSELLLNYSHLQFNPVWALMSKSDTSIPMQFHTSEMQRFLLFIKILLPQNLKDGNSGCCETNKRGQFWCSRFKRDWHRGDAWCSLDLFRFINGFVYEIRTDTTGGTPTHQQLSRSSQYKASNSSNRWKLHEIIDNGQLLITNQDNLYISWSLHVHPLLHDRAWERT